MLNKIEDSVILKHDTQVPRYTSYPTAPHFTSQVNGEVVSGWLKSLPQNETLSLYIHIPFCQQLCWYCGCYTKATNRYAPVEDYAHILAREIHLVANLLAKKNRKVSHIHFGGGSPTILLPQTFEHLMQAIRSEFEILPDAEIAIEVDPRNVSEEKIATYAKAGINRVSIGVQDFNLEVQQAINRVQSFDLVYDCIRLFREYKIDNINLDLIYGLPKQTLEGIRKNIDYAMLLKPSRIALFAYAHVQWMKKHMRLINEEDLPDGASRLQMYKLASEKLQQEGFFPIGLDHFAKKNDSMFLAFKEEKLKRNFQGYSTDTGSSVIGFGASAISYFPFGYSQNTLDFDEYKKNILSENLPTKKGVEISDDDKLRKKIIDELMCYLEVDLNKICEEFGLKKNHFDKELARLDELQKDGLVRVKNNVIKINLIAPQISRVVSSVFDKFFEADAKRHSKIA
ncbi:MAG: oxygen-independent coproporphyrinogen III oxidase [Rickettsiales bacterium]|nr:oxygen-independent coproporphyrinogen III oxidase [Rickettsiales bacterium]